VTEKTRILVVDDDPDILEATARLLHLGGYEVIRSPAGKACLTEARKHLPHLILLGAAVPGTSGAEICARLKKDPALRYAFVVLLSGSQTPSEDLADALEIGADGYIARPISDRELLARVQSIDRIRRTEEALRASEERYRDLYDHAPVPYFSIRAGDGSIRNCNQAAEGLLGFSRQELLRMKVFEMYAPGPQGQDRAREIFALFKDGKSVRHAELQMRHKKGHPVWIDLSIEPFRNKDGTIIESRSVAIDITERKLFEDKLRKLSQAVEHSPASVVITDAEGTIEYVNPKFVRLTGYSASEAIGQNPRILKSGRHPPEYYQEIWGTIGRGKEWRGEFYNKKKSGDFYWEYASISPIKDDQGIITNYVAVKEDITDRKQTEEALFKTEETAKAILNASMEAALLMDTHGILLACNDTACRRLGGSTDDLIGQNVYELLPLEVARERKRFVQDALRTGKPVRFEDDHGGRWLYHCIYPVFGVDGEVTRIALYDHDITEIKEAEETIRRAHDLLEQRVVERTAELVQANEQLRREMEEREQAEEALRISERKYSTLVENSLTGIFLLRDGKFVFANQKLAEILGYARDELLGMDSLELAHPEDRDLVRDIRGKRIRGEDAPSEYETRVLKKTGETIWIRRRATLTEYNGRPAILGTIVDITERKRVEEELRKSERELRGLSSQLLNAQEEERKRIAWELHDTIAQNLVSIQLALGQKLDQMGEAEAPPGISLEDILHMVQDSVSEVRRIMAALRPSILDDLGIRSTIDWHCREFQKMHPHIHLEKQIPAREEEIPDELKIVIFRILQEALTNVAKHSKATVATISLTKSPGSLELMVADTGSGFDQEAIPRDEKRSWGMGLSSMRERTELSGGTFAIASVPGEGTTVRASWPV